MKSLKSLMFLLLVSVLLLAACTPAAPETPQVSPEEAALQVTGSVASPQAWSEEMVKAMETLEVESTNKDGETSTYTGVLISDLLAAAGPNSGASTVVFVADDGFTAETTLEEVNACSDCIVSFRNQGGFSVVMPGYPGNLQVKGVVEIQVQ